MSVLVTNLIKTYNQQYAVNDISFAAAEGQVVGFLGPNGAGKSTTMKIATCFIPPTAGEIEVCGYKVTESHLEVRRLIGYLPEHNPLYLDMYVHEYLRFIGSLHELKSALLKTRVADMVELCGLTREQNKKIGALSKGYRQRVGLAQALVHDPKVLILDEPTTGLDPNQILEIRKLIKEVSKDKTVIFSTHIMQEVQALCDRVVIINQGKVVADDVVANLQGEGKITEVEFSQDVDTSLFEALESVELVTIISSGKYAIKASTDVREKVFALAKENNWNLIGMNNKEQSLESIFHRLTENK